MPISKAKAETLHYRGLCLYTTLFKKIERLAKKENRKINPLIGILLEEALQARQELKMAAPQSKNLKG